VRFNHHEPACAIAAESYFRLDNDRAVVNITTGLRGTNAITGVSGTYVDSIGMVVLTGKVKREGYARRKPVIRTETVEPAIASPHDRFTKPRGSGAVSVKGRAGE
jgi:glyoxylate carboligase